MERDVDRLRELVRKHRMCFECRQDLSAYTGVVEPVGFVIELYATYPAAKREPTSGCEQCDPVDSALRDVALYALPEAERRLSFYEVHASPSISYSARRHNRPDREVTIEVLHKHGANNPIDECERVCRGEIVSRLREIGVCEGAWAGGGS